MMVNLSTLILPIIYQDEYLVAINKPHNLLVHRSKIAADEKVFALQLLRDQLGSWVSPCHRIDRKTSGVLLFALSPEIDKAIKKQFENQQIRKKYLALVRGFLPDTGTCERPLAKENGEFQSAVTNFTCLQHFELKIAVSRYPKSRYSLVEIIPETGRMHQIRRHFAQIRHYLVGDKTYGECKHNKMFEEKFGLDTMLLHAKELTFTHPISQEKVVLKAEINDEFEHVLKEMKNHF